MSRQPHGERETRAAGAPARDAAGQQAGAAPERAADDHLIRGYN